MRYARRSWALAGIGVAVVVLGACGSSSKPSSSSPSTTAAPTGASTPATGVTQQGDAQITTFVVPASVQCGAASKTTVHIEYGVTHAARQEISVDGLAVPGVDAASGTVDAPVHCDGVAHTIALIAFDAKGARTAQVKYLNTLLPG